MAGVVDRIPDKAGIQKQIMLPWSKALQMTRENIFVRLGRSVITASGIFLGVAFLTAVLFGSAAGKVKTDLEVRQGLIAGPAEMQPSAAGVGTAEAQAARKPSGGDEAVARTIWLVAMSLVVATVGIVNSMLTSVTERYKEIGTMKCLGALDKFIVRLFILEALVLGLLGSLAGAIVGTGAMTVLWAGRMGWESALDSWNTAALQIGQGGLPLWACVVLGVVVGGVLSVMAALYPAWRAAKMPPAAALRSEF